MRRDEILKRKRNYLRKIVPIIPLQDESLFHLQLATREEPQLIKADLLKHKFIIRTNKKDATIVLCANKRNHKIRV